MIVYLITNKINNKKYVGQTTQTTNIRWTKHRFNAVNDPTLPLHRAIHKYGPENFEIKSLVKVESDDGLKWLNILEPLYIKIYNTLVPDGYNLEPGGKNNAVHPLTKAKISHKLKGHTVSEETKKKISITKQGKNIGSNNPMYGKPSPLRGKKHTSEAKAKMSAAMKGNQNSRGFKQSPETVLKRSIALKGNTNGRGGKGKIISSESRAKMSATHSGIPLADTHRANISKALKGRIPWNKGKTKL